jgi:putative FmdB family regulatory protein
MPTYDYVCEACDHKFELYQSIKDEPIKKCPQCKKSKLRRLFGTGAAVMFKGSGFYTTDYRSESYKKSAKADSSAQSGASDSKPADTSTKQPAAGASETKATPKETKATKSEK